KVRKAGSLPARRRASNPASIRCRWARRGTPFEWAISAPSSPAARRKPDTSRQGAAPPLRHKYPAGPHDETASSLLGSSLSDPGCPRSIDTPHLERAAVDDRHQQLSQHGDIERHL